MTCASGAEWLFPRAADTHSLRSVRGRLLAVERGLDFAAAASLRRSRKNDYSTWAVWEAVYNYAPVWMQSGPIWHTASQTLGFAAEGSAQLAPGMPDFVKYSSIVAPARAISPAVIWRWHSSNN